MFNFHKPRTYRSTEGCCICKAKSSSSRFTDSRKYERDTMQCFDLKYPRQGEICNACVLLVKRFKRLPVGSKRNWSHIVDAKAGIGPGYNKIQTKYKSERINSKAAAQHQTNGNSSSPTNNSNSNDAATCSVNGLSYIPEKFSKIFKKTRKLKDTSSTLHISKRKACNNGWSQNNIQSLTTMTPDSLDSDYEDTRLHASNPTSGPGGSTVVQFQTQTRASAYKAQAAAEARRRIIKLGSKRRKCLPPRKYRRSMVYEESLQFFDEEEWQERKFCCGMLYECSALGGALLINTANYKCCEQHQHTRLMSQDEEETKATNLANKGSIMPLQKSIIQTMPAVVQLQLPQGAPLSATIHCATNTGINNNFKTATTTPTPVLKKHHLFFKRQSECFPQGDMFTTPLHSNNDANATTPSAHVMNIIKTESDFNVPQQQQHLQQHNSNITTTKTLQKHIENAIQSSSPANTTTILTNPLTSSALSISVTSSSTSSAAAAVTMSTMPQMPKHSLAKVTTISPPLTSSLQHHHQNHHNNQHHNNLANITSSSNSTLPLAKPNSFLHKTKSDAGGKVVKHSLEKFNTAVRLKTSDIHEMKPIIRTVDKSYILSKPPTQANIISLNATTTATATYQSLASYNAAALPPLTTASLSAASPTSSTSSTSSTKFSDNSSDSGFDENMSDRKSASPLQEDCEKKILSRPGVQTMFLASGVQIQGQPQNLVLTGNEVAAKILQNRKYSSITTSPINQSSNYRQLTTHHPSTTAVKIAQISTTPLTTSSTAASNGSSTSSMSSAAQAKMRAIYNNNNTIQHENGITTIVPASSLAASTQTAAMQNIAPSTVTITPAPPVGTPFNPQNVISRKLTTTNIINLQSNTTTNLSNSHHSLNSTNSNHPHQQQHHLSSNNNNNHNTTTNQKIILLKTSPNNTTTVTATAGNYNTLGGVQHGGGGGGGR